MDEDVCDVDGCTNSLDDGEGFDGYCGEHADHLENMNDNERGNDADPG